MTVDELAHACSVEIIDRLTNFRLDPGEKLEAVRGLVRGAVNRALDEQTRAISEVVHVQTGPGAIDVKVTKSTQGVSLEVDVKRPREPGESEIQAAEASAYLVTAAYERAARSIAEIGLVPGKEPKA